MNAIDRAPRDPADEVTPLFRVMVLYPRHSESSFDIDYYKTHHLEMARQVLEPYGLAGLEWSEVVGAPGDQMPVFHAISHHSWRSVDDFRSAVQEGALARLAEDVPNFYSEHSLVAFVEHNIHWAAAQTTGTRDMKRRSPSADELAQAHGGRGDDD